MEELNFDVCLAMSDLNANDEEAPGIGAYERLILLLLQLPCPRF